MSSPEPYKISIPSSSISKLHRKLADADFPDELELDAAADDQWPYGAPLADVKRLASRWREGFDWRKAEAGLNELPQFRGVVEVEGFGGVGLHFVHVRGGEGDGGEEGQGEGKGSVPLLFVHGCKSEFLSV
jgi:hypothetical protein